MGKTSEEESKNKGHKTLRQKLRKKREQIKKNQKQKKIKHSQYNPIQQKQKFFSQKNKQKNEQLKIKKITKYLKKFINIYEDDLNDFYDIFKTFDQKGEIDISEVENKNLQKCLKKLFKYLPLIKSKLIFKKNLNTLINLEVLIKNKINQLIEDYLQNGTQEEEINEQSQSDQQKQVKVQKQVKKQTHKIKKKINDKYEEQFQEIPQKNIISNNTPMGPFISKQERQKISELLAKQIQSKDSDQLKQQHQIQNQQFDRIFAMSTSRNKKNNVKKVQEIPQHLLAQGSAKIGQKVQIDSDYFTKYDKEHRPKKLIDQHRQIMQLENQQKKKKSREPFDRQRDIVDGRSRFSMMNNGVFFDFKDRMTKPKDMNSFL